MDEDHSRVGPVIAQHGGRVLAAGPPVILEGNPTAHVAVIIEFPSLDHAQAWYDAADYQDLKALRQLACTSAPLPPGPTRWCSGPRPLGAYPPLAHPPPTAPLARWEATRRDPPGLGPHPPPPPRAPTPQLS